MRPGGTNEKIIMAKQTKPAEDDVLTTDTDEGSAPAVDTAAAPVPETEDTPPVTNPLGALTPELAAVVARSAETIPPRPPDRLGMATQIMGGILLLPFYGDISRCSPGDDRLLLDACYLALFVADNLIRMDREYPLHPVS